MSAVNVEIPEVMDEFLQRFHGSCALVGGNTRAKYTGRNKVAIEVK